jgi:hypothetical protein
MATKTATKRTLNRAAPKGLRRADSRVVPIRVTPETLALLRQVAESKHASVSEVVRGLVAMGLGDPGGTGRAIAGQMHEDLGGPRLEIERVLVDPAVLELHGQLRLLGG